MSNQNNAVVWAIVVLFVSSLASIVLLTSLTDDSTANAALVGSIMTNLGAIAAVMVNLNRTNSVGAKVDQVAEDAHNLVNGLLDAKVRAGVADVIHDDLIDPDATHQLRADRARRAEHQDPDHNNNQEDRA